MKLLMRLTTVALVVLCASVRTVDASPILAPVAGTTTMGEIFPLLHAFDQTGLSATYISGVTDFATFTASTTHDSQVDNDWVSSTTVGSVTFDLGTVQTVDGLAFWNFGGLGGNPSSPSRNSR
jgi:hypothetical protein